MASAEDGDLLLNFLHSMGIKTKKPASFQAQKTQDKRAAEPKPDSPETQFCSCVKNPHYHAPPAAPLELHAEVEARSGRGSVWSRATVIQIHKTNEDYSKRLYNVQYENNGKRTIGLNLRRCLIRKKGESLKLFCTACGLPPKDTKGFKSFKAGKGNMTFWAKPEVLYGLNVFCLHRIFAQILLSLLLSAKKRNELFDEEKLLLVRP